MSENKNEFGWKKFKPCFPYEKSECFYQKKVFGTDEENNETYAVIVNFRGQYEINCQIDRLGKKTLNTKLFGYTELDFKQMEEDILEVIKKLFK